MPIFSRLLTVALCLLTFGAASAADLSLVNLAPGNVPVVAASAKAAALTIRAGDAKAPSGSVVLWEARAGVGDISGDSAKILAEYVRRGGALFLSFSQTPGTGPFRLGFMLPTTAWHTQGGWSLEAMKNTGAAAIGETDATFFAASAAKGLRVPFYFPIRPFHAVERGEARYERFGRTLPYINLGVSPDNTFWTRPLINRDWRIRARANDGGETPLLLTGRYGAGRVAVFASSVEGLDDSPAARALFTATLQWLAAKDATAAAETSAALAAPTVAIDKAARTMQVTIRNPGAAALPVLVVARISTWERALIGDAEQSATLPAGGEATVSLPLPTSGTTGYQALTYRDAFDVRLGILSSDGSALLNEIRHTMDVRPAVGIDVTTDNVRLLKYPYKAPGPEILNFQNRMGAKINGYAYPPGAPVRATVSLSNAAYNIAPLAAVRDETTPNNVTTPALTDEAMHGELRPNPDKIPAYGAWEAQIGKENVVSFTYPNPVTVSAVTLVGSADNYRNYLSHNPGAATVELDGKEVVCATGLDARFLGEAGQVHLNFAPQQARVIRVILPWVEKMDGSTRKRYNTWLGEIRIHGTGEALPAPATGIFTLSLKDELSGASTPVATQELTVRPGTLEILSFPFTAPAATGPRFYSLEASFAGRQGHAPFMALQPTRPLQPFAELKPPTAPDLGFIVTRGFRNVMPYGTGTAEIPPGWATPDDLIWAYSHQMKQLGPASRTQANRLYLTESDMRHYSTPWRDFPNGVYFYDVAPSLIVERMKRDPRWKDSPTASLSNSDRWDAAPDVGALNGWQDFIGFDEYLRAQGLPGLKSRTRLQLADEIHSRYENRWQAYQLERYARAIRNLREAFAKEGKELVMTAQGSPLVPSKYEKDLTATIRGQSDDSTYGMVEENPTLTVGRQMGILAFNPGWEMSTLIQWGWESAVLQNIHWHTPVGTTEASRRMIYDRAWRGTIGGDGNYKSVHTYGYSQNGGVSFTMTPNDWQQWWRVEERHSLIAPDAPLGAGLIISTARFGDPDHTSWSGQGGWGTSAADEQVKTVERAVRRLQEARVAVPFATNVAVLGNWRGDAPLIILDLSNYSAEEVAVLEKLKARGVRLAAFAGAGTLSTAAATLFGVTPDGGPAAGKQIGTLAGKPLVGGTGTLFIPGAADDLTLESANAIAVQLQQTLQLPLVFPEGTAGYGFESQGKKFIVVEDWREEGRTVSLRLHAGVDAKAAHAIDANDHRALPVHREGADWIIDVPLRPADATLICLEES